MITEMREMLNKDYASLDILNDEMREVLNTSDHDLDKLLDMAVKYEALLYHMIGLRNYINGD